MESWIQWSNPVAVWWIFLSCVSAINIVGWIFTWLYHKEGQKNHKIAPFMKRVLWLSAAYVFVCAFRSLLPRADVQRICLFDSWWSSVFVGRSFATIAELSFVAQWAIVLNAVAKMTHSKWVYKLSFAIVPLIFIAECFSWTAVITTDYLGNTLEESTWALTYCLISLCLMLLWPKFKGSMKFITGFAIIGCLFYVAFMVNVDVPMYFHRWQADSQSGKPLLGFFEGLQDLNTRWRVSYEIAEWKTEIPWMTLYFSFAVWSSLALCYVPSTQERIRPHLQANHKS